jgi:phosphoglycerate dehydrogenase-like enzyme
MDKRDRFVASADLFVLHAPSTSEGQSAIDIPL